MQNLIRNLTGKKYVISDIHGMYGAYKKALEQLTPNDTLYILGDVIDRGPDGIKILQDIIRQNPKRIHFLLGNHEWQMITVLNIINKYNLPIDKTLEDYCELGYILNSILKTSFYKAQPQKSFQTDKEYRDNQIFYSNSLSLFNDLKKDLLPKNKYNLTEDELISLHIWLEANSAFLTTFPAYYNLNKQEQSSILDFLNHSKVLLKTQCNNKKFLLVHAAPPNSKKIIQAFEKYPEAYVSYFSLSDYAKEIELPNWIETRNTTAPFSLWKEFDYTTIYGHTPKKDNIIKDFNNNAIRIDSGCSIGGKLAMYCLDDDSCIYINPQKNNEVTRNYNENEKDEHNNESFSDNR